MSDVPHFICLGDEPQQIVMSKRITPGKIKGKWVSIPLIIVQRHPGITTLQKKPAPQQNGTGKEQPAMDGLTREAMKKPVQTNHTTKE